MKVLSKIIYRKSLYIKKVSCCGCYFDKICYILKSNDLIEYETFENSFDAHWYFKDFISGVIVVVCDDIFSLLSEQEEQLHQQRLLFFTFENLYEFELAK